MGHAVSYVLPQPHDRARRCTTDAENAGAIGDRSLRTVRHTTRMGALPSHLKALSPPFSRHQPHTYRRKEEQRPPPSNHALPSIRPGGRSSSFRQSTVGAHPGLTGARDQHTSPEFHIGASFYPDIRPPPWTASTEPLPSVRTFFARSPLPLHRVAPSNLGFELCVLGVRARRESAAVRTG